MAIDTRKRLYELLAGFTTGMLVTRPADGTLHARPLAVAELKSDADIYFSTSIGSPKIAEIEADPRVVITFQSPSQFVALRGQASVVRDRALIDKLWSDRWRVWFPGGRDDPDLCLLKFDAEAGEYWDNGGLQGAKFLFQSMKAIIAGRQPQKDDQQSAKVDL
jgi:general stress protein 26